MRAAVGIVGYADWPALRVRPVSAASTNSVLKRFVLAAGFVAERLCADSLHNEPASHVDRRYLISSACARMLDAAFATGVLINATKLCITQSCNALNGLLK
jgi:hypothetical protein